MSGQKQYGYTGAVTSGATPAGPAGQDPEEARAATEARDFAEAIAQHGLPVVSPRHPLPPGESCHFVAPVRSGRRRSDSVGYLELTSRLVRFHGATDRSIAWTDVTEVARAGREIVVSALGGRRPLRLCCHTASEAARASVVARYLASACGAAESDRPSLPAALFAHR